MIELCRGYHLTAEQIAAHCYREAEGLRDRTLTIMVKEGLLRHRFGGQPNLPGRAYITVEGTQEAAV